ncbi:MAG: hypothetical protein Q9216_002008 [Gyalolechia sp. 2 TL-2023]
MKQLEATQQALDAIPDLRARYQHWLTLVRDASSQTRNTSPSDLENCELASFLWNYPTSLSEDAQHWQKDAIAHHQIQKYFDATYVTATKVNKRKANSRERIHTAWGVHYDGILPGFLEPLTQPPGRQTLEDLAHLAENISLEQFEETLKSVVLERIAADAHPGKSRKRKLNRVDVTNTMARLAKIIEEKDDSGTIQPNISSRRKRKRSSSVDATGAKGRRQTRAKSLSRQPSPALTDYEDDAAEEVNTRVDGQNTSTSHDLSRSLPPPATDVSNPRRIQSSQQGQASLLTPFDIEQHDRSLTLSTSNGVDESVGQHSESRSLAMVEVPTPEIGRRAEPELDHSQDDSFEDSTDFRKSGSHDALDSSEIQASEANTGTQSLQDQDSFDMPPIEDPSIIRPSEVYTSTQIFDDHESMQQPPAGNTVDSFDATDSGIASEVSTQSQSLPEPDVSAMSIPEANEAIGTYLQALHTQFRAGLQQVEDLQRRNAIRAAQDIDRIMTAVQEKASEVAEGRASVKEAVTAVKAATQVQQAADTEVDNNKFVIDVYENKPLSESIRTAMYDAYVMAKRLEEEASKALEATESAETERDVCKDVLKQLEEETTQLKEELEKASELRLSCKNMGTAIGGYVKVVDTVLPKPTEVLRQEERCNDRCK